MSTSTAAPTSVAPIYSMTGFARTTARVSDTLGFTLTLKSVNHRFLDLHLRLPAGTDELEMRMRRYLKDKLGRGHVEVTLSLDRSNTARVQYNRTLVGAYLAAFHAASQEFGIIQEPNLNTIFRLPGVLAEDASSGSDDEALLADAVIAQMDSLVAALNTMRAQEGQALTLELRACLDRLESLVDDVAAMREDIQRAYFDRVSQRLAGLLNGTFDRERVLQEAALLAERSDVQEEITRLHTHIGHFRALLDAGGEIGKKTDFLLQELNREANTLLSKSGGVSGNGPRITELGLGMKSEIEKAREQVQNLE